MRAPQVLSAAGKQCQPNHVVVLDVPAAEVVSRITGRRIDPVTNKIYHLTFNPPPVGEVAER